MTKATKRALFYSAVAVFLIASYFMVLYAQGYKYSFSEGKFLRTGTIALKTDTGAKVFLDDKLEGNTSFFNNSYGIDGILPGVYTLSVEKENYSPWRKTVSVEEGLVTDFPRIILLPEEGEEEQKLFEEVAALFKALEPTPTPAPTKTPRPSGSPRPSPSPIPEPDNEPFRLDPKNKVLSRINDFGEEEIAVNVEGLRFSKDENKLAWWSKNELWILWLNDQNYQPLHKKGDRELIKRFLLPIQNISWFRDEDHLVLELETRDSKNRPYSIYEVVEIDTRGGVNVIEL